MALSLEIKLVILLPTFLFFVGFIFRSLIENKSVKEWEKTIVKELDETIIRQSREPIPEHFMMLFDSFRKRSKDFEILLTIDSLFLIMANSLIIMFELDHIEIGVISLIVGNIFVMYLIISLYCSIDRTYGFLGVFGLLGGEFVYFLLYDSEFLNIQNYYFIILPLGAIIGLSIYYLILKRIYEKSLNSLESHIEKLLKKYSNLSVAH